MGSVTCKSPRSKNLSMYREQLRSSRHSMTPTPQNKALFFPWRSEIPRKFTIDFCNGFVFPQKKNSVRLGSSLKKVGFVSLVVFLYGLGSHGMKITDLAPIFGNFFQASNMQENAGDFLAWNHPIGSIYHLYTTYILPIGWLYATYHLLRGTRKLHWKKPNNLKGTTMGQICKSASSGSCGWSHMLELCSYG